MKMAKKFFARIEFLVFLFFVSLILFLWPLFSLPLLSNIVSLFKYLYILWGALIVLLFVLSRRLFYALSIENTPE